MQYLIVSLLFASSLGGHGVNVRQQDWGQLRLSALSMIRLRWQMDSVRLVGLASDRAQLEAIVREARTVGLSVVYRPGREGPLIEGARYEAADAAEAIVLRKRGAAGKILVPLTAKADLPDGDWEFGVSSGFDTDAVDEDRDAHLGQQKVVVTEWGLDLSGDHRACRAVPNDPEDAREMVVNALDYFEEHGIGWYANFFAPGWLIQDFHSYEPTVLFGPWECGKLDARRGMGEVVQYHRWGVREGQVVAVGPAGSPRSAPGALTILYGSQIEKGSKAWVIDGTGSRTAVRIVNCVAGQMNFEMPMGLPPGEVKIEIQPGRHVARIQIDPVVPAIWTRTSNAQGEAVTSRRAGRLILHGSGFHAARKAELLWQGKVFQALHVGVEPGIAWNDEVHFPGDLPVQGEAVLRVDGVVSNAFVLP